MLQEFIDNTLFTISDAKMKLTVDEYVKFLESIGSVIAQDADVIFKETQYELDILNKETDSTPITSPEITEDEYNKLFQADAKDQFNQVEEDITKRSAEYNAGRPLDP